MGDPLMLRAILVLLSCLFHVTFPLSICAYMSHSLNYPKQLDCIIAEVFRLVRNPKICVLACLLFNTN